MTGDIGPDFALCYRAAASFHCTRQKKERKGDRELNKKIITVKGA